jgi:hypothetical protein
MGPTNWLLRPGCIGALFVLAHGASLPTQEYTILVGTVGTDTVAVDRFLRDELKLEGVLLVRQPRAHTLHYKAALAPEGRFTHMEMTWRDAEGNDMRTARITFGVDSIRSQLKDSNVRSFSTPPSLDAIPLPPRPWASHAYSILEHAAIVITMSQKGGDVELPWVMADDTSVVTKRARRVGADTLEIEFIAGLVRAGVGEDGRLVWMSGEIDSVTTVVRRAETDIDIDSLKAAFASRDTMGRYPASSAGSHEGALRGARRS